MNKLSAPDFNGSTWVAIGFLVVVFLNVGLWDFLDNFWGYAFMAVFVKIISWIVGQFAGSLLEAFGWHRD